MRVNPDQLSMLLLLPIELLSSIADADAPAVAADRSTAVVAAAGVKRIDPDH